MRVAGIDHVGYFGDSGSSSALAEMDAGRLQVKYFQVKPKPLTSVIENMGSDAKRGLCS